MTYFSVSWSVTKWGSTTIIQFSLTGYSCLGISLLLAIGLALFIGSEQYLMPSFADCCSESDDSVIPQLYKNAIDVLWKRYPLIEGEIVRKGTSHFGKHTAQFNLDGYKLHIAAKLFAGHKPMEGARNEYFSNPFPHLLDGAKALGGWTDEIQPGIRDKPVHFRRN